VTKQTLMELALTEQLRERQEMEKKLQKLAKTMDYFERAKREESAPLIEAAFRHHLVEEKIDHEREQQVYYATFRSKKYSCHHCYLLMVPLLPSANGFLN
jgi:hypothetical protein